MGVPIKRVTQNPLTFSQPSLSDRIKRHKKHSVCHNLYRHLEICKLIGLVPASPEITKHPSLRLPKKKESAMAEDVTLSDPLKTTLFGIGISLTT